MVILKLIAIVLFILGVLIAFEIGMKRRDKGGSISFKKAAAKSKRLKINAEATLTKYEKIVLRIDALLEKIGKTRTYLYCTIGVCFLVGSGVGYICFSVPFLAGITGAAFIPLTYLYLIFRTQETTREELAELQNTMSVITNAYLSNNDIVRSVEMYVEERRRYQDGMIHKVTPFEEFVLGCLKLNTSIGVNLSLLAAKINNKYFDQWIKNLQMCMEDKEMRFALQPVIDAMVDEKIMQMESDTQMQKTWVNYLMVVAAMFAVIPAFRLARKEWYLILTNTAAGQIIICLMLIAALISAVYVMKINKPIGTI